MSFLGGLIGGIGSVVGGLMGYKAQKQANAQNAVNNAMQYDLARNTIKYRVQDAKNSGIHPLYALGAPTMSSATIASQPNDSLGRAISQSGQALADIALRNEQNYWNTKVTKNQARYWFEKSRQVGLENAKLDPSDPLHGIVGQNKGQNAPRVAPGTEYVLPGGHRVKPVPGETRGSEYEDNYGEAGDGVLSPFYWNNLYRAWRDYYNFD